MSMGFRQTPRVAFSLNLLPKWKARYDMGRWLRGKLSSKFGNIALAMGITYTYLTMKADELYFSISIRRRKDPRRPSFSLWEITVAPSRYPVPRIPFPENKQAEYLNGLRRISDELHAILLRQQGVGALRWWFPGWNADSPGKPSPSELPWRPPPTETRAKEVISPKRTWSLSRAILLILLIAFLIYWAVLSTRKSNRVSARYAARAAPVKLSRPPECCSSVATFELKPAVDL